ncbi:hypothetical protein [Planctomycetes bacterium K23_9]|uniref:Uncharacterized protein n=1 Tax=Stieleria marina TaxID=1930275 RepID=A0A517NRN5_9BACT|nr:hypothetical protein K239x_17480 [Planctomycetes bacterium K23_9]
MPHVELQSAKYLSGSPGAPSPKRRQRRKEPSFGEFLFRLVLILGLILSVHWFYKHQDPILANIRENSDRYSIIFTDLVKQVRAEGTDVEIEEDDSQTNELAAPKT